MLSHISLNNLIVNARHGVHTHEKENPQRFQIDLSLEVDTTHAFTSDELEDTISYSDIRNKTIHVMESTSFNLLERLVQEIADNLLADSRIKQLTITIAKLDIFESGIPSITATYTNP